jgi:hypothetical protein
MELGGVKQPVGMAQLDREVEGSELLLCCPLEAQRLPNDRLRKMYDRPDNAHRDIETVPEPPDWVSLFNCAFSADTVNLRDSGQAPRQKQAVLLHDPVRVHKRTKHFRRTGSSTGWPTAWIHDKPVNKSSHLI